MANIVNQTPMQVPVSPFDPNADLDVKRKRKLAEILMKQGEQPQGTEVVSGVAVKQSPWAGLARSLTQGLGGYTEGQADKAEAKMQQDKMARMAEAIKSGKFDSLAQGSPDEQMLALKAKMDQQEEARKFAHDLELARLKEGQDGSSQGQVPDNKQSLANALGVPVVDQNLQGMSNKDISMYKRQARTNAEKALETGDYKKAADLAANNQLDVDRLKTLMSEQDTGSLYAIPGAKTVAGWFDPQVSEINSIQARLAPQQRVPGSGSTSDFDAKMFEKAVPSVDKPKETNNNIIAAIEARSQTEQQHQAFLSDFLQANGHLNGADNAWKKYLNDNPIFDKTSTASNLKLNKNRQDYKTYFGGSRNEVPNQTPQGKATHKWNPQTGQLEPQ